jgi:hypothetical protein
MRSILINKNETSTEPFVYSSMTGVFRQVDNTKAVPLSQLMFIVITLRIRFSLFLSKCRIFFTNCEEVLGYPF